MWSSCQWVFTAKLSFPLKKIHQFFNCVLRVSVNEASIKKVRSSPVDRSFINL